MATGRFSGKVVIVTGAGSGIGAATATRFLDEGARVVLVGRTGDRLEGTAAGFPKDQTLVVPADVTINKDNERVINETLSTFGQLDILINNAATAALGEFLETSEDDWRRVIETNLFGVLNLTRAALPLITVAKGSIINISSLCGLGGDRGLVAYGASKAALSNLTRTLALEYGSKGVRVNAVCPSVTFTEMNKPLFEAYPAVLSNLLERIPMGRGAEPSEIASVVAFLASEDASFVNGVNLPVDGGASASSGQASFI